uniref:uncharacterized protein LOC122607266 n=1 Tax=Erigeron canadensis TaxID=72917 RepID=UPI001CB916B0|nr:uncharacterized protein LOC122607266 [Erigeron canadensis]
MVNTPPSSVHGNTPPHSVHNDSDNDNDVEITKISFIDGTCVRSDEDEILAQQWDRCNAVVLSWILNCVTEELYLGQIFSKNASVVWSKFKETYDKVDGVVTFNLHNKINSLCQNGSALSEYYHKLNSLWKQFDALIKLPTCVCHVAKDFQEHNKLIKQMQFLMGLDESYHSVRSQILTNDPLPSVKSAYALLSREESLRNASMNSVVNKSSSNAFASKFVDNRKKFNSGNNFNRGPNTNLNCTHCKGVGHTIDRCFELVGYPPGYKKKSNFQSSQRNVYNNNVVSNKYVSNTDKTGASSSTSTSPASTSFSLSTEQMTRLMSLFK